MFVSGPQIHCYMALDGFNALLFAPSAREVLPEITRTILRCFLFPHSRLEIFLNAI